MTLTMAETHLASRNSAPRWSSAGTIVLVMSVALYALSRTVADLDLWGHIKFGEHIWRTGRAIQPDPYSYVTGGQTWFNHEWLAEVIFYQVFSLFGVPGLVAFKTGVSLLILALVYRHLCRQGLSAGHAGVVVLFVAIMLVQGLGIVHPKLFTYLLFLLLLLLIHAAEHGRVRRLWWSPVLFGLWANLHPGFMAGLAVLFVWSGVHIAALLWRAGSARALLSSPAVAILAALITSVIATLVTPFGTELWRFLGRGATFVRPDIAEWLPLEIASFYGMLYLTFLVASAAGLVYSRAEHRPALIALWAGIALAPLTASRHGGLFALGMALLAGGHMGSAWARWTAARPPRREARPNRRLRLWASGIALALAVAMVRLSLPHFSCIVVDPIVNSMPARAVALLKDSGASGNMAVFFDWGEYVLWHLSPRIKVSMDGRRETAYSDVARAENLNFLLGTDNWDAILQNHDTHLALVSKRWPSFNLMKLKPGWPLIYEDSLAAIFAREGSPLAEQITRTRVPDLPPDGRGHCFP
jgi:hypothetical protein